MTRRISVWDCDEPDVEISEDTYNFVRDKLLFHNRSMQWLWLQVLKEYGCLTEQTILKFMNEKWI